MHNGRLPEFFGRPQVIQAAYPSKTLLLAKRWMRRSADIFVVPNQVRAEALGQVDRFAKGTSMMFLPPGHWK